MTIIWQQHEKYATPSLLLHYVSAKTYELHTVNAVMPTSFSFRVMYENCRGECNNQAKQ
jgi:hypothetical protein